LPFPSNWTEELICEYLELEGYFVKTNNPISLNRVGGRGEMDAVGIKLEQNKLKIIHIETGIPSTISSKKISRKFGQECNKEVQRISR